MYKLGFLTLILSAVSVVSAQQVICDDNGNGTCVTNTVICDDNGNGNDTCATSTVICDDNGNGTCVTNTVICDDNGNGNDTCATSTVICDDNGNDTCATSTVDSKPTSTWDANGVSSYGKKNSVMYIFGLLPLLLL
jgi:hypothetical protein